MASCEKNYSADFYGLDVRVSLNNCIFLYIICIYCLCVFICSLVHKLHWSLLITYFYTNNNCFLAHIPSHQQLSPTDTILSSCNSPAYRCASDPIIMNSKYWAREPVGAGDSVISGGYSGARHAQAQPYRAAAVIHHRTE